MKGNGWSKISYEGGEAYIKSEFLEPSETQQADAGESAEAGGETQLPLYLTLVQPSACFIMSSSFSPT